VQLSLAWPSISKKLGATGRVVWHGEPLDTSVTLSDFRRRWPATRTGVKLRIAGVPMKGAFEGAISLNPTIKIDGHARRRFNLAAQRAGLARQKPLPGGGFARFAIKAQTNVVGSTIGLTSVNLELDGNSAEGVLTFATDGRRTLQGTLAADSLDLSPYVSTVKLLTTNHREWSNGPITLDGLNGMDVDLRLSAASLVVADAKIGHTAIGANLRAGHLVVTIGEAQAYGGVIKGSLTLANVSGGVNVKSQLQFTDVDLESSLGQLFGLRRIEGKGNMALVAEGTGDSVLAVTRTLNGSAMLTGQNGAITGLNVEQLLLRLERRPFVGQRRIPHRPHALRQDRRGDQDRAGHRQGRGHDHHRAGGEGGLDRLGLDPDARSRFDRHRHAGSGKPARYAAVRVALHRAGLLGRSDHAARRRGADPPVGSGGAVAQRRARPHRPRFRSLGAGTADGSPLAPAAAPPAAAAIPAAEQSIAPAPAQKAE